MNPKRCYPIIFLSLCLLYGCANNAGPYQDTRILLGTYVTIKVQGPGKGLIAKGHAVNEAFAEIKRIEDLLSSFKEGNAINKINNSGTKEVFLDEEIIYLLKRAKYFYRVSGRAFDVTILPLLELWGFRADKHPVPPQESINEALNKIGSDKIVLNNRKKSVRFRKNDMKIDLGGIAKGYAVDKAALILKKRGIKNALIDAGGDIYCLGEKAKGQKWIVGVKNPAEGRRVVEELALQNLAAATSAGYENFLENEGKQYGHIIDPRN